MARRGDPILKGPGRLTVDQSYLEIASTKRPLVIVRSVRDAPTFERYQ